LSLEKQASEKEKKNFYKSNLPVTEKWYKHMQTTRINYEGPDWFRAWKSWF